MSFSTFDELAMSKFFKLAKECNRFPTLYAGIPNAIQYLIHFRNALIISSTGKVVEHGLCRDTGGVSLPELYQLGRQRYFRHLYLCPFEARLVSAAAEDHLAKAIRFEQTKDTNDRSPRCPISTDLLKTLNRIGLAAAFAGGDMFQNCCCGGT